MTADIPDHIAAETRQAIIAHTRATYATKRQVVEQAILREREDTDVPAKPVAPKTPATWAEESKPESLPPQPPEVMSPVVVPPVVKAPSKPKKPKGVPTAATAMGKGGRRHKYLQHMVSQCGQQHGWRATIEMPVKDGSIDVVLERDNRRIAFEISVTTSVEMEVGNLRKCLDAGFSEVFMLCDEHKTLKKLQASAERECPTEALKGVRFLNPEELFSDTAVLAEAKMLDESIVRGYKVKVHRELPTGVDAELRRKAIADVLAKAMRDHACRER
jgi:hypothetical protein